MKKASGLLGIVLLISLSGCTSAERSKIGALGENSSVVLYSCDGHVIAEWTSNGTVHNEESSDGYYFTDSKTGRLIRVHGTVVVTAP